MDDGAELVQSDMAKSGYTGVHLHQGRYKTECNAPPCHDKYLGTFDTPEEGAQAYLQHQLKEHPEELKKERKRPVLIPVQEHFLIRSGKNSTGYKAVQPHGGQYQAKCTTSPCLHNSLGMFGTPEEAAQAYLRHYEKEHQEELKKEQERELGTVLIQSSRSTRSGCKGVKPNHVLSQEAQCTKPPCKRDCPAADDERLVTKLCKLGHGAKFKKNARPVQEEHLKPKKSRTSFKGLQPQHNQYQAKCTTSPCRHNSLGMFGTPEEAAQVYLQHYEKEHPEELKKEQALLLQEQEAEEKRKHAQSPVPACLQHDQKEHPEELAKERVPRPVLPLVQKHLLLRSDRKDNKSGFKGVYPRDGRYQTQCNKPPCRNNNLGIFDTAEEGAQVYLQHFHKEHPEELKKEQVPRLVLLPVQEHLLVKSGRGQTGYKGVYPYHGRYKTVCNTPPCQDKYLGFFDIPEEAAQAYLQHHQKEHPEELAKERVPRPVLPLVQKHLLLRSDKGQTGYEGVREQEQQQPRVGVRISVHWPEEGQWFSGRVFEVSEDDGSYCVVYDDGDKQWHSWQGEGAPEWRVDRGKTVEVKGVRKKRKLSSCDEEEQHL